jgi:hypothetical protein
VLFWEEPVSHFFPDACTCLMVRKLAVTSIVFLCQASCSSASFISFCKVECWALCLFVHCLLFHHSVAGVDPICCRFVVTALEQEKRGALNPVSVIPLPLFSHFVIHFLTACFGSFVFYHCLFLEGTVSDQAIASGGQKMPVSSIAVHHKHFCMVLSSNDGAQNQLFCQCIANCHGAS